MATRRRTKQVAFFEIRDVDGHPFEDLIPWEGHLAELSQEPADKTMHRLHDIPHWGQVYTYKNTDHLILARLRDGVSSLNMVTGEIIDTASDAGNPWVETSVIHFLPGTNKFGFVLGSNASPQVSSLQAWINNHGFVENGITIEPVIAKDVLAKLYGAAEASVLRVKFAGNQLTNIKNAGGLFTASRQLQESVGHASVEVILRVEGGAVKGREGDRVRLHDIAKSIVGSDFRKAAAKLVEYDDDGHPYSEDIDFVKHRITRKMKMAVTDKYYSSKSCICRYFGSGSPRRW